MNMQSQIENNNVKDQQDNKVIYICGACGQDVILSARETAIRCKQCGHRIIFKKRVRMLMTYEAR